MTDKETKELIQVVMDKFGVDQEAAIDFVVTFMVGCSDIESR